MFRKTAIFLIIVVTLIAAAIVYPSLKGKPVIAPTLTPQTTQLQPELPIFISALRKRVYPPSDLVIEQTLAPGINYARYIASYHSDGLKIYGLYTVPDNPKPDGGFPTIVFLHGHLDPTTYITTERYVAYQDGFARSGFITFKPDLRGHGKSEGTAVNASFSEGYVVDALNVVSSFKQVKDINPSRIGIWGHSMGGGVALRAMVVSKDIKAGVIWAGVVGDYSDLLEKYYLHAPWMISQLKSPEAVDLFTKYGSPSANPSFWQNIDPYYYLADISGPVQLHHGLADDNVPIEFSRHLQAALQAKGKTVEEYEYPGSDHNIAQGFSLAMQRSVEFFKKFL